MIDLFEQFRESALGTRCVVTRYEYSWRFLFGDQCWIVVTCLWRIVNERGILFASGDDGHQFGLPTPVDGEDKANELFGTSSVVDIALDRTTADLVVSFENGTRVDVFNSSAGYEGWQAGVDTGSGGATIVGLGGGSTAEFGASNGK